MADCPPEDPRCVVCGREMGALITITTRAGALLSLPSCGEHSLAEHLAAALKHDQIATIEAAPAVLPHVGVQGGDWTPRAGVGSITVLACADTSCWHNVAGLCSNAPLRVSCDTCAASAPEAALPLANLGGPADA